MSASTSLPSTITCTFAGPAVPVTSILPSKPRSVITLPFTAGPASAVKSVRLCSVTLSLAVALDNTLTNARSSSNVKRYSPADRPVTFPLPLDPNIPSKSSKPPPREPCCTGSHPPLPSLTSSVALTPPPSNFRKSAEPELKFKVPVVPLATVKSCVSLTTPPMIIPPTLASV